MLRGTTDEIYMFMVESQGIGERSRGANIPLEDVQPVNGKPSNFVLFLEEAK
jgi:hypothetical protein